MDLIVAGTRGGDGKKVSVYDSRMRVVSTNDYPPGNKAVEGYLGDSNKDRRMNLMEQIHASKNEDWGQVYRECNDPAYYALKSHDGEGVIPDIVGGLEGGVRFLFFNGMEDVICNHYGNEVALDEMVWEGGGNSGIPRGTCGQVGWGTGLRATLRVRISCRCSR